ncbi:glycosyltransferase family 4 protein [Thermodesulfovibrionales bacterium]|nr:glycosyltransferase family 4 protein [Thermodesulfovibrionales bacterium]
MADILFITDELPFPPRNGVTVASFHFLSGLTKKHQVSLLFLQLPRRRADRSAVKANRQFVKNLWVLDMIPSKQLEAILNEAFCRVPYFARYTFNPAQCMQLFGDYDCDVLWATPIGSFAQISSIEACMRLPKRPRLRIAAINDSYTSILRSFGNQILGTKWSLSTRALSAIKWLRGWGMSVMEARILEQAHHILVQSKIDKEWIGRISRGALIEKTVILPNGVDFSLLEHLSSCEEPVLGYIGDLSVATHNRNVKWILDDVLPYIRCSIPDVRLVILGKAGSSRVMERINKSNAVEHISQVKEMKDFYQTISVLLVRDYKCLGLINRTVEAMAAGIIVIGERGAFNGIEGFQDAIHGFVAESTGDVVDCFLHVLSDKSVRKFVSHAAHNLMKSKFRWTDRIDQVNLLIKDSLRQHRITDSAV